MNKKEEYKAILIKYRLEQAEETLKDANLLLKAGSPRGIVNRAYYAMFYAVLALLTKKGEASSKHSGVIALFDTHFVKSGIFPKAMSKVLHKAFDFRQTSDYRELIEISKKDAEEILHGAKEFVAKVRNYLIEKKRESLDV